MNLKKGVVFAITITIELSVSLFLGFGEIFMKFLVNVT